MGKRGPAPEPTHLKIVKDNPGNRPLNYQEPKPCPIFKLPSAPRWFDKYAKKEWKYMGIILIKTGVLTEADMSTFEAYCCAHARWRHAEDEVLKYYRENGRMTEGFLGKRQRIPELVTLEKAFNQKITTAQRFGMDPSARTQIRVDRPISIDDFL